MYENAGLGGRASERPREGARQRGGQRMEEHRPRETELEGSDNVRTRDM